LVLDSVTSTPKCIRRPKPREKKKRLFRGLTLMIRKSRMVLATPIAVQSLACVDAWAGAASGGSFLAVAPVAVWGLGLLLREALVDY